MQSMTIDRAYAMEEGGRRAIGQSAHEGLSRNACTLANARFMKTPALCGWPVERKGSDGDHNDHH